MDPPPFQNESAGRVSVRRLPETRQPTPVNITGEGLAPLILPFVGSGPTMSDQTDDEAELDEEQEEETKEALRSFRTSLEIMKRGSR